VRGWRGGFWKYRYEGGRGHIDRRGPVEERGGSIREERTSIEQERGT